MPSRILLLPLLLCLLLHHTSSDYNTIDTTALEQALRSRTRGLVFPRGSPEYAAHRSVSNGGCRHIYPAIIARPRDTADVAETVRIANEYGIELSVRGGGHSYQCQGTKQDSLNIDMRSVNTVKLVSPYEAQLGGGADWGHVLKKIDNKRYTLIHGQCLQVGVGGYLLGMGINLPSITARHGTAADSVIEHTVVLANGDVARVTRDNTTVYGQNTYGQNTYGQNSYGQVVQHGYDNDLRFALRTSGSSFGIATEFRVRVWPRPETLPMLIPVFIEDAYDFKRIERASLDAKYGFFILESYFFRKPAPNHLLGNMYLNLPRILRLLTGKKIDPVILAVSDISSPGRKGNIHKALNYLKYFGIKLAMDNPGLMSAIGMDGFDLSFPTIESGYLTDRQRKEEGFALLASANMLGLESTQALHKTFFTHPVFGRPYKQLNRGQATGCDFCSWFIYLNNPALPITPIPGQHTGLVSTELTCAANPNVPGKSESCAAFMRKVKAKFTADAYEVGERPIQYMNTPSCDEYGDDFTKRYWGQNYERLLKIKNYWDPSNVFHHCHSVGSTSNDCCPI